MVCGEIVPEGRLVCPGCEELRPGGMPRRGKRKVVDPLVSWVWIPAALMAGAVIGILIVAMCTGGR